jgi:hypothetical protein
MRARFCFYLDLPLTIFIMICIQELLFLFLYCLALFLLFVQLVRLQFVVVIALGLGLWLYLFFYLFYLLVMRFYIVVARVRTAEGAHLRHRFLTTRHLLHPTCLLLLALEVLTTVVSLLSGALQRLSPQISI